MSPSASNETFTGAVSRKVAVFPSAESIGAMPEEYGRMRAEPITPPVFVTSTSTGPSASKSTIEARERVSLSTVAPYTSSCCQSPPAGRTLTEKLELSGCPAGAG